MNVASWSSLADQQAVAEELFGDSGSQWVVDWLADQLDRVDNVEFARGFSDHIVQPANPEHLRAWHNRGQLKAIVAQHIVVGLFAAAPGAIGWLAGDEVNEEIIDIPFAGKGYAASAQAEWARTMPADATTYLVGTIDGLNTASRKTAHRAGRPIVLDDVFISLRAHAD